MRKKSKKFTRKVINLQEKNNKFITKKSSIYKKKSNKLRKEAELSVYQSCLKFKNMEILVKFSY